MQPSAWRSAFRLFMCSQATLVVAQHETRTGDPCCG
jgi:hypothetical protein